MTAKLEEIKNGVSVRGIASAQTVHVISVEWIGDQVINVVYRDHNGAVAEVVLYRDDEHRLSVAQSRQAWSFDADGALLRPEGDPVEMTGARLRALRDGGELTIHPATYRLIYDLGD